MKHGILAHQQIDTSTPLELYTFGGAAAYTLHADNPVQAYINGLPLPKPDHKHLANAGDVIAVSGSGTVLLEGIEQ